jgi:hypothetical protein
MAKKKKSCKKQVFSVKDCAIITQTAGLVSAINLRELKERIAICPVECLYFHFCETLIRPTFDDPEFRNDLALWAAVQLRDRVLAERLGIINPYNFDDFERLREKLIEIVEERLSELQTIPSVPKGEDFILMRAATVVFDAGIDLHLPSDLLKYLPAMSNSSIYYHFLEARRRTPDRVDDFTFWMQFFEDKPIKLIDAFSQIDFYFLNLSELKQKLIDTVKSNL